MIWNIIICALAAAGLLAAVWLVCAKYLLPIRTKDAFLVLAARGRGEALEQQCRAYLLLKNAGILQRPLLIVDLGLDTEGRCLAQLLKGMDGQISVCRAQELCRILQTGE